MLVTTVDHNTKELNFFQEDELRFCNLVTCNPHIIEEKEKVMKVYAFHDLAT